MRILTALLAAVATLAPAAGALGGTVGVDVGDLVGSRWHLVTDYINGIGGGCDPDTGICSVQGTYITVSPEGARFDVAKPSKAVIRAIAHSQPRKSRASRPCCTPTKASSMPSTG